MYNLLMFMRHGQLNIQYPGLFSERFGDGDTSQIGLDFDEVIFCTCFVLL